MPVNAHFLSRYRMVRRLIPDVQEQLNTRTPFSGQ